MKLQITIDTENLSNIQVVEISNPIESKSSPKKVNDPNKCYHCLCEFESWEESENHKIEGVSETNPFHHKCWIRYCEIMWPGR